MKTPNPKCLITIIGKEYGIDYRSLVTFQFPEFFYTTDYINKLYPHASHLLGISTVVHQKHRNHVCEVYFT